MVSRRFSLCKSLTVVGIVLVSAAHPAWSGTEGTISGSVLDDQGVAVSGVKVELTTPDGRVVKEVSASATGEFTIFPVEFGDYAIKTRVPDFSPFSSPVHVSSGSTSQVTINLSKVATGKEIVLKVEAKRKLVNGTTSQSSTEVSHDQIEALPQGNEIPLPKLLETTAPGVVQGPFGQIFIRGNHANIQYQIDGVQLPDSVSGTFAEAFSTRNIDHFEFITGGIPAEYGERLAAVVNIVTKTGPEIPAGELELNYGSYNTFSPQLIYGGSTASGEVHYFLSANYSRSDRGLDTPQPVSTAPGDQSQGGTDSIHDSSNGNNEFLKLDWLPDNEDKYTLIAYQNYNFYQIPNYPSSFSPSDPYFGGGGATTKGYTDAFGNSAQPAANGATDPFTPLFNYTPAGTNDTQANQDAYLEAVWKHTFSERSFLQLAPYWKYSKIKVDNDEANDLAAAVINGPDYIPGSAQSSFALNQHVNNLGLKTDYSMRPDDRNLVKTGFQLQASQANDNFFIASQNGDPANNAVTSLYGGGISRGYFEDVYVQDDFSITKALALNAGVRFTAVQFHFSDATSTDDQAQPRVGLSYLVAEDTKVHAFYGRLFMPAPLEDLREAFDKFNNVTTASSYDIKAEKDNYYEVGVDQQVGNQVLTTLNVYYKRATDMLDDTQLLNTSIAAPYNYADGYAYGVEFSVKGRITTELSSFFNYSYEIAKGENISGGSFALTSAPPANTYLFLDHVQEHTANAGLSFSRDQYFATVDGLFGSGLRTGNDNSLSLPSHFSFDLTAGYTFKGDDWLSRWKVSGDILNLFDNVYPITIANGFNGSHYAAGREFFIRLTKEL